MCLKVNLIKGIFLKIWFYLGHDLLHLLFKVDERRNEMLIEPEIARTSQTALSLLSDFVFSVEL